MIATYEVYVYAYASKIGGNRCLHRHTLRTFHASLSWVLFKGPMLKANFNGFKGNMSEKPLS